MSKLIRLGIIFTLLAVVALSVFGVFDTRSDSDRKDGKETVNKEKVKQLSPEEQRKRDLQHDKMKNAIDEITKKNLDKKTQGELLSKAFLEILGEDISKLTPEQRAALEKTLYNMPRSK